MAQVLENPCSGALAASRVAEVLDGEDISYIAVGWLTIAILAQDIGLGEVEFVVRDADLEAAVAALEKDKKFRLCKNPDCPELRVNRHILSQDEQNWIPLMEATFSRQERAEFAAPNACHLVADAHFHLAHKKRNVLRWFPVLEADPELDDPSLLWLSNDAGRLPARRPGGPSGAWTKLHPVQIPDPTLLGESVLMLFCRDYAHVEQRDHAWCEMWERIIRSKMQLNRPLRPELKLVWETGVDDFVNNNKSVDPYVKLGETRRLLREKGVIVDSEIPPYQAWGRKGLEYENAPCPYDSNV